MAGKKLVRIDVSSDTVCPWCCVGKKNLDKAMSMAKDCFDFEVLWDRIAVGVTMGGKG